MTKYNGFIPYHPLAQGDDLPRGGFNATKDTRYYTASPRTWRAYEMRAAGAKYPVIAAELGISIGRAGQLVKRFNTILERNRRIFFARAHTARIQDPDGVELPVAIPALASPIVKES